jgi:hypothetical protein
MRKVKVTQEQIRELVTASEGNPALEELAGELPGLSLRITKDKGQFSKKGDILEVQHCEDNKIDFHSPFRCTTTNPEVDKDDIWQLDWIMEGLGSQKYLEIVDEPHKAEELLALWEEAEQLEDDDNDDYEEETASVIAASGPSEEQKEVMEEVGMDTSDLKIIEGKNYNHHGQAYTDGNYLAFVGMSSKACDKFLYYMGAENEAEIVALWKEVAIYEGISESRLEVDSDEEEDSED